MPHLTDARAMQGHLRESLNSRTRWVFLTDCEEGHRRISTLALGLTARWLVLGLKSEKLLGYGVCEWMNPPTRHRATISFLTVPKSALAVDEVLAFVGQDQDPSADQDILLLTGGGDKGIEMMTLFASACRNDKFQTAQEVQGN